MTATTLHRLFLPLLGIACLALALPSARAQSDGEDDETVSARSLQTSKTLTSLNQSPAPGVSPGPTIYVIRNGAEVLASGIQGREKVFPGDTIVIKSALTWFKKKTPSAKTGKWLPLPGKPLNLFVAGKVVRPKKPTGPDGFARFEYKVPTNTPPNSMLTVKTKFDADAPYAGCFSNAVSIKIYAP